MQRVHSSPPDSKSMVTDDPSKVSGCRAHAKPHFFQGRKGKPIISNNHATNFATPSNEICMAIIVNIVHFLFSKNGNVCRVLFFIFLFHFFFFFLENRETRLQYLFFQADSVVPPPPPPLYLTDIIISLSLRLAAFLSV